MVEDKNMYTIEEFCQRNTVSRTQLDKLWARGTGPRKRYVGSRVRITHEAERDWLASIENPDEKAQRLAGETAEMLREKARRAGAAPRMQRGREA